ncbi:hypothetical protein [Burkholderia sp. JKS000303]|uniref:hypothetical protein n=1 Tax=Burkholderia sp. JKS000303 TaxID=1938747 RepID=UPI000C00B223|nr:hypothetical protein [Burkholderia sp. JKS000303]PFH12856.1 hypothetical protein BX604_7276 [Burkholderia sp. JKS000303]
MSSAWLNVRIGRYFVQAEGWRMKIVRKDDAWMLAYGRPFIKVWKLPGCRR